MTTPFPCPSPADECVHHRPIHAADAQVKVEDLRGAAYGSTKYDSRKEVGLVGLRNQVQRGLSHRRVRECVCMDVSHFALHRYWHSSGTTRHAPMPP